MMATDAGLLERISQALGRLEPGERGALFADVELISLPGRVPPWTASRLELQEGSRVTQLAAGEVVLLKELDLRSGPAFALWKRIGGAGPVFRNARDTATFAAARDGRLELGILSGEFASPEGDLDTPPEAYAAIEGGFDVALLHWRTRDEGEIARGIERLAQLAPDEPLLAAELARLRAPTRRPSGWEPHWRIGESDVFSEVEIDGRRAIRSHPVADTAIYRRPIDVDLEHGTALEWSWRVDRLPSSLAEDALPQHDYLSIAVEFSDGRDLSWFWSAGLPVGHAFACPIPAWTPRETHLVIRSGDAELGRWVEERRDLHADCQRALGDVPVRIAAVWLIAVSLFQRTTGDAYFADITLTTPAVRIQVL